MENLIKNFVKIKKLKKKNLTRPVKSFQIFSEGPSDLGHDHSLF